MHIKIPQIRFSKIISNCGSVIETNTTHELLSHLLIEATKDGTITVVSTDLDISMIEKATAEVIVPGKITVEANVLRSIIQKCSPSSHIELKMDADRIRIDIKADSSIFNLATLSSQNYPTIQDHNFQTTFTLPFQEFKKMLDLTAFAISNEETRYNLNGIYLHSKNPCELRLVATDGHRLTKAQCYIENLPENIPNVIISKKTVDIINSIAKTFDEQHNLTISVSDTLIKFSVDKLILIARLIDGTFPQYESVIPIKDKCKCIYLDLEVVYLIVSRATIFGNEKVKGIKIIFDQDIMRFVYEDKLIGSAHDEIAIIYNGEAFQIGFNSKYLMDAARNLKYKGDAEMWVSDENSPILFKNTHNDDSMCVIMPMRL